MKQTTQTGRSTKTMDGNTAAAHVSYAYTEVAAIYPITPSTTMAELTDKWAATGRKNLFGQPVQVIEMQSEAGAAGAVHGSLIAGALTTTFTASQGLLLMIPNMYKIAGELLPGVINVAARAIATHALSIFGDHSDIYACRQTGFAFLSSSNVQEVMDLAPVAHCVALKGRVPFVHFFDGFRTSHEIQKIEVWNDKDLMDLLDESALDAFRARALNPEHPVLHGSAQNPDIFFQAREASNPYYDAIPDLVEESMQQINAKIGTNYQLFSYYGHPQANHIIIAMGSVCDTISETVDFLNAQGEKLGFIKVHLYRPFSAKHLLQAIPNTVSQITVLDRAKEPGSIGEPLYLDILAATKGSTYEMIPVYSGRYGLGSKDTTPGQIAAVFHNNLFSINKANENDSSNMTSISAKKRFTIGIHDDVTNLSLQDENLPDISPQGTISCKFWGLGSDGTVGANKNTIKIIGDYTDKYVQAYFEYDSKKSGGVTISHLRFGDQPIHSSYLVSKADFVACHHVSYLQKYDMVRDLKDHGNFLINCGFSDEELIQYLPDSIRQYIVEHHIHLYTIDGVKIGRELGLGGRINTILQAAFFKVSNVIPMEKALQYMKEAVVATYGRKGDVMVAMNQQAIERGANEVIARDTSTLWNHAEMNSSTPKNSAYLKSGTVIEHTNASPIDNLANPTGSASPNAPDTTVAFADNIQKPMNRLHGNELPVSAFSEHADGSIPQGLAAFEKRGIASDVPEWNPEVCIQCNLCSLSCPHAVIRPAIMNKEQAANAPKDMKMIDMKLPKTSPYAENPPKFAITISPLDCTGCGICAHVCPQVNGRKALDMKPIKTQLAQQKNFDYGVTLPESDIALASFPKNTMKGSQFKQPLLEFPGACAGCGETPYAKLVTQLFGDRMMIANATGCSSIWGGSAPSTPYTVNKQGKGPAWANSLFEDNAEFGFGMLLAQDTLRERLKTSLKNIASETENPELKTAIADYLNTFTDSSENATPTQKLIALLEQESTLISNIDLILKQKDFLSKKSQWIFGGDGWAYDIGFGGLDHVIASGRDVNILVFDTEIYSNTGGQSSKSTPTGATAQFSASGKMTKKKDLAQIAMSYESVYVAQVSLGADYAQCVRAITEAESYKGPSIIIAYAPCISHGIKGGMSDTPSEEKRAVQTGYWHLFRYDPRRKLAGENPFILDSKAPSLDYEDFLLNEVRFTSIQRQNPEKAKQLFALAKQQAKEKYERLKELSEKKFEKKK